MGRMSLMPHADTTAYKSQEPNETSRWGSQHPARYHDMSARSLISHVVVPRAASKRLHPRCRAWQALPGLLILYQIVAWMVMLFLLAQRNSRSQTSTISSAKPIVDQARLPRDRFAL